MCELRDDTFSENKNDDVHEHVERVLDIVSLFNILGVSHDAVMLRVFPITLTGVAKRWMDRLHPGTIYSWDLLKKPLSKVKSMEEVKYGEFGQSFPNNKNDGRFNRGGYDQPSSREKRPSLTKIINKYMEEASMRHDEQDEQLKKFYQSTETSREAHDKIIQGVETKMKTLVNEVEGRANNEKLERMQNNMY
uniref:Retrotransposon gag domain-containing protein n=1 Tax=Tanacetum cinerariifolium TaxID=118510 RepID=A0A6L2KNN8_TANCI|nr:hypothetical protein [Tanacetum cinerariifolium]